MCHLDRLLHNNLKQIHQNIILPGPISRNSDGRADESKFVEYPADGKQESLGGR